MTWVSRNPVPPQLCSSPATSLGTHVYQNSSPAWLCATTSRNARSTLVGKLKVLDSALDVEERKVVPAVGAVVIRRKGAAVTRCPSGVALREDTNSPRPTKAPGEPEMSRVAES